MGESDIGNSYIVTYPEARALMPIMAHLSGRRRHPDPTVGQQIDTILEYGNLPPSMLRDIKGTAGRVYQRLQYVREDVDYSEPLGGKQVIFDDTRGGQLYEGWLAWSERQGLIEE